ncbi:MAG: hypothetical protein RQ856_02785 [Candidatus Izemoplasmatales bacterium]|nr:hypothetical protein [Candidatus Izemoplasmatales bacterium]
MEIGSSPIFPNMMFLNSSKFHHKHLSKVISLQMVIGYMGFGILTPLTGLLFDRVSISLYPYVLIFSLSILTTIIYLYLRQKSSNLILE